MNDPIATHTGTGPQPEVRWHGRLNSEQTPKNRIARIVVDRKKCRGIGLCEVEAVDLFEVQNGRSLVILNAMLSDDRYDAAEAAMVACPTEALSIVED